jgi:hypothetical protein
VSNPFYVPGWENLPDEVEAIRATLPIPFFKGTPADLVTDIPDHVFLWDADRKVLGSVLPPKNQGQVGSCVSFGTNTAIRRTMLAEIANGEAEEFKDIVEEVTYGGSRVEVGGGRINGDGSVGAWAADFVKQWGVLERGKHGNYDLSQYSESTCRQFGSKGVPDDLEPAVKLHPVKTITQIKSWDEAKKALASGYAIAICSNQGFSMQRNSDGVCKASGSWAHCMALDGYRTDGGEFGHIENSWGPDAHTGPVGPGEPNTAGFWTAAETIDRMLRQDDSWAFSSVQGFPARKLRWLI